MVFIGDSLTAGLYATTADRTYVSLVVASMHATLLQRVGVASASVSGVLGAVEGMRPSATDVVIEVGTNDFGVTVLGDFNNRYLTLIDAVQRHEPRARFTCLGIWRGQDDRTSWGLGPESYNAIINADCPGRFVDLTDLYMSGTDRGPALRHTFMGVSDSFHPNDAGHQGIASLIVRAWTT